MFGRNLAKADAPEKTRLTMNEAVPNSDTPCDKLASEFQSRKDPQRRGSDLPSQTLTRKQGW